MDKPKNKPKNNPKDKPKNKPKNKPKVALITGITGQDSACLAEFLLSKG
jgi:hypothetical protein